MKLKMLVGLAGMDFSLSPNEETDRFAGDEAQRLIEANMAVPVHGAKIERTAKKPAPEKRA